MKVMSNNTFENNVNVSEMTTNCTELTLSEQVNNAGAKGKQKSFIQSIPEKIPAFGLLCCLLGEIMFSLSSLIVKELTQMHSIEVLVFRCIVQIIPFFIISVKNKYPLWGVPGHRIDLALRCIVGTASLVCQYMSYRLMPLSDSSSIFNSSPIFTTIFAYFLLKERITLWHILTGLITIAGVFIISKPQFLFGEDEVDHIYDQRTLGIILSCSAAILAAYTLINLRKLKTTPVPLTVTWYSLSCIVSGSVLVPILDKWRFPSDVYVWLMLVAIGITSILQQYFLTTALKYESPGPISVTRSFNIVLAFIWEIFIFSEPIEWTSVVGACMITSCVIIIALLKCHNENPQQFKEFFKNIFKHFCHKSKQNMYSVSNSSQTSINTIDQDYIRHSSLPIN